MPFKYSENLIERTRNHFKQKYNLELSNEEAEVYLSSFSSVFRSFVRQLEVGETTSRGLKS